MAKKDYLTSPRGRARYPHLNSPDTKFDADGVYTLKLVVEGSEGAELAEKIDGLMADSMAQAREDNPPVKRKVGGKMKMVKPKLKEADAPYVIDDDGSFAFNFKMKAKGTTKAGETFTRKPAIFDATGTPCPKAKIGGGSLVRVSFEPFLFYTKLIGAGVSLRLAAVQVLELVEWGQRDADGFGFEAEDDFAVIEAADDDGDTESEDEDDVEDEAGDEDDDDFDF